MNSFSENQMISSSRYFSHLNQLKAALEEKRLELVSIKCKIFHQDNVRPHVSLMTKQELLQLGWEILIHPLWSSDIAPLDCHLFQSLQNSLNGKKLNSLENYKRHMELFFAQKDKKVLGRWNYEVVWKMAEDSGTKRWIHCSIELLVKTKNVSFIFYLKTKGTFWPTQYLVA